MIKSIEIRGRRLFVNGKPWIGAADHTWFVLQNYKDSPDFREQFKEHKKKWRHNCDRVWVWHAEEISPRFNTKTFYNRLNDWVSWCVSSGIVPIVMLFNYHVGDKANTKLPLTRVKQWHKDHVLNVLAALESYPCILEVCNEVPKEGEHWQQEIIKFIRSKDKHKRPICVTTGFGTKGMTERELEHSGADMFAILPPTNKARSTKKVLVADTDHLKVLNKGSKAKIQAFKDALDKRARILLHMRGFPESQIKYWDGPVEQPRAPGETAKFLGDTGTQIRNEEPEPEPKPEPKPEPLPEPPEEESLVEEIAEEILESIIASGEEYLETMLEDWIDEVLFFVEEQILTNLKVKIERKR